MKYTGKADGLRGRWHRPSMATTEGQRTCAPTTKMYIKVGGGQSSAATVLLRFLSLATLEVSGHSVLALERNLLFLLVPTVSATVAGHLSA